MGFFDGLERKLRKLEDDFQESKEKYKSEYEWKSDEWLLAELDREKKNMSFSDLGNGRKGGKIRAMQEILSKRGYDMDIDDDY